jgi:hypothetical protein
VSRFLIFEDMLAEAARIETAALAILARMDAQFPGSPGKPRPEAFRSNATTQKAPF